MKIKDKTLLFILMATDIVAISASLFLAYFSRNHWLFVNNLDIIQPFEVYLMALPVALVFQLIIFYLFGLYHLKKRTTAILEIYTIFRAVSFWSLLIMAGSYLIKYDYSRIVVILFWLFSLVLVNLTRYIIRSLQTRGFRAKQFVIIGSGRTGKTILTKLEPYKGLGLDFIGFIDSLTEKNEVIGAHEDLYGIISEKNIELVYIADPSLSYQKILEIVDNCPKKEVEFKIASSLFPLIYKHSEFTDLDEMPSLNLKHTKANIFYRIAKRLMDLIIAIPVTIILFPLAMIIMILIRKDSPGPALLAQDRVGLNGKIFKLYKFRTMHQDVNLYEAAPIERIDPRITKTGKWLRNTSLDEVPQLLNIIKGEMSLVGPRPEMPFIVAEYEKWQKKRLLVKPGLTGLWQILGRKDIPLRDNLEYDFYYINNQSLFLDIIILLKTIPLIIFGKGAY